MSPAMVQQLARSRRNRKTGRYSTTWPLKFIRAKQDRACGLLSSCPSAQSENDHDEATARCPRVNLHVCTLKHFPIFFEPKGRIYSLTRLTARAAMIDTAGSLQVFCPRWRRVSRSSTGRDKPEREADQDRCESRELRSLYRFPDGRGGHSPKPVRRHLAPKACQRRKAVAELGQNPRPLWTMPAIIGGYLRNFRLSATAGGLVHKPSRDIGAAQH
jgi:hypothetical protein